MRQKLSVTVITLDEEANIADCLKSVAWADELVVVDAGSEDGTQEVCWRLGAKVYSNPWSGFAAQKNLALSLASHPWVLSLDADERATEELREEVQGLLGEEPPCDGYYIPRKNIFMGKWLRHGDHYPDWQLRLFRREKGRFLDRPVHESVEVEGSRGYLEGSLEHLSYRGLKDFLDRLNRYSALAAEELYRRGVKPRARHFLLRPPTRFFRSYVLQRGFLDGAEGLILAACYSFYVFMRYAKLWELRREDAAKDSPH